MEKLKLIDLYNELGKIVNKYPYYELYVTDEFKISLTTGKLLPKIFIDRNSRKIYFQKTLLR